MDQNLQKEKEKEKEKEKKKKKQGNRKSTPKPIPNQKHRQQTPSNHSTTSDGRPAFNNRKEWLYMGSWCRRASPMRAPARCGSPPGLAKRSSIACSRT